MVLSICLLLTHCIMQRHVLLLPSFPTPSDHDAPSDHDLPGDHDVATPLIDNVTSFIISDERVDGTYKFQFIPLWLLLL